MSTLQRNPREKQGMAARMASSKPGDKMQDARKMEEESQDSTMMDYGSEEEGSSMEDDLKSEGTVAVKGANNDEGDDDDEDDDDDDKDTKGGDDVDDNSDPASQRQSKRKPSKSRIKRILPQDLPAHSSLSPDAPFSYPSMDQLSMVGSSRMTPPSMASLSQSYLEGRSGQRRPSQSGELSRGYQCNVCGKEFRVPSRYESHMLSHSKGKPFCCDVCGKLFASQQKLDVHKPVHGRSRKDSFSCPTCGHVCTNWRAYLYHVAKHTTNGGKKHICQVCGRQFHAAQRLRNHMQSHIEGKNFCCLICGKLFESKKRLDTHSIIHDSERREPFSCVDCGKVYEDWRAFKQHMKTHGSDGVIYRCEICSAQFLTQYEKEKHKRVHTSDKRYQCQHCQKCFRSQSVLAVHERKHLGQKGHECTICSREFSRAFSLRQHMKMHAGEEEFMCHLCGRTFARGEDLSSHTAEHAKEREFVCDQCGKSFAFKNHYHRHLVVHAAGQPFSCGVCGKLFDTQSQLQSHTATHRGTGRQHHACLACSDVFESQLELEAHAHTHGKSPPYVCGLCGKMFAEQRYFRQHMKRHTARAQKQKLQAQGLSTPVGAGQSADAESNSKTSPGSLGHTCHMCGQKFGSRQLLIAHIEDHKRSGLLMYFNLMDGQMRAASQSQKRKFGVTTGQQDSSEDESETASDSEASEETEGSKLGRGGVAQGARFGSSQSHKGGGQSDNLTAIAERAMALRMQPPSLVGSHINSATNTSPSSARPSVIKSEGAKGKDSEDLVDQAAQNYFSSPVFPGQMGGAGSHATPYHAAAHSYQQSSQDNYSADRSMLDAMNNQGSFSDGGGSDVSQQFGSPQQGLPGFADFRRQFGLYPDAPNTSGATYPSTYPGPMTSTPHFSTSSPATSFHTAYSSASILPHSSPYMAAGKQMAVTYDSSPPMVVYSGGKMPVFPGMLTHTGREEGAMNSHAMPQSGVTQQYEPMLQFQPLSS